MMLRFYLLSCTRKNYKATNKQENQFPAFSVNTTLQQFFERHFSFRFIYLIFFCAPTYCLSLATHHCSQNVEANHKKCFFFLRSHEKKKKKKAITGNLCRNSDNTFIPTILFASLKASSSTQQPLNSPALALTHRLIKLYMFRWWERRGKQAQFPLA